jgi:ubiquinone/menaquinone biosynthesis C-methylase UbiE
MAQEWFFTQDMPDALAQWRFYLSLLGPEAGQAILDVGCHEAEAEWFLLHEVPEIGRVIGVDDKTFLHANALHRWRREGSPERLELHQADARSLPFPAETFDRVLCVEVLEAVDPPGDALREMVRVLKPGGIAVVVHSDYDQLLYHCADLELNRSILRRFADAGPNPQMGRQLLSYCRAAGFREVGLHVYPLVNTEWDPSLYGFQMAEMISQWLLAQNLASDEELARWRADLDARGAEGRFFCSINRYVCRCVK